MSKLFRELGGTYWDRLETAGQHYQDSKKKTPFEIIMEADNEIFNSIKNK